MTLGTLFGFALPAVILLASVFMGGGVAMNLAAVTPFLFALSLAYAVVKHDLFEIDAMVKRGAYYLLLTGAVGARLRRRRRPLQPRRCARERSRARRRSPSSSRFAVLLALQPAPHAGCRAFVDRVFFRTRYDGAQVLAGVGRELASALTREHIAALVRDGVEAAIPNARHAALRRSATRRRPLREVGGGRACRRRLVTLLAAAAGS